MSQILLVSADSLSREPLAAALDSLGHGRRVVDDLAAAEQALTDAAADILIVDTNVACTEGRDALRRLRKNGRPRVVWTGPGVVSGLGLVFAEIPDGVLPLPTTMGAVGTVLARLDRPFKASDLHSVDMTAIDGSFEHFPPFRVLWAASHFRSSGRLELYHDEVERELFLLDGRIVAGRGFAEALDGMGVQGDPDDDLESLIGQAIASGTRPDLALEEASRGVGRVIARLVGQSGGMVFFDPHAELPDRKLPLPLPMPRLLADALADVRPIAHVRQMLGPLRSDMLAVAEPGFGPKNLPPVALRLWRAAEKGPLLGELLREDDAAWMAADLLLQLGLARLQARDVPEARAKAQEAPVQAPPRKTRLRKRTDDAPEAAGDDAPAEGDSARKRDPVLVELVAERKRLTELDPLGVMGIQASADLNEHSIDERYRLLSARFHPDRYATGSADLLRTARDCFAVVNDAYQALKDPDFLAEAKARLAAKEAGKAYVTDGDRRRARLLFAKGDVAYRRKALDEALENFELAHAANPLDWRTAFMLTRVRFELGAARADECAMALMELEAPEGRQRSDLLYHLGEMLLAADREQAAFRSFEQAVDEWEHNVDAKRRIRLRKLRREGVDAVRALDADERERRAEQRAQEAEERAEASSSGKRSKDDKGDGSVGSMLGGLFRRKGS